MRARPVAVSALVAGAALVAAAVALPSVARAKPAAAQGGSGVYSHTVYSQVTITGDTTGGQGAIQYVPAQCWLEPRFTGGQSWTRGDPQSPPTPAVDADTYWFWFAGREPGLTFGLAHQPGARQAINAVFRSHQGAKGYWWWVPAWLNDPAGWACAQGLVQTLDLNNAFLQFGRANTGGTDTPGHTIDPQILADLARAALRLPDIAVTTNPAASRPSDVNLPVWVSVSYTGKRNPSDTASVPLPGGGTLSVTVSASQPTVTLSVSSPGQARVHNHCGATGSPYSGNPAVTPPCGVTFLAPSTGGPFTVMATARWTVRWTSSTGQQGGFSSPPWPPAMRTRATLITVREIQSINTPTHAP